MGTNHNIKFYNLFRRLEHDKKTAFTIIGIFFLIFVFTTCQTTYTIETSKDDTVPEKSFRAVLEAGDVEGTIDFLESGVSLSETDAYGKTPIFAAVRYGHADLITLLLFKGADPEAVNVFEDRVRIAQKERQKVKERNLEVVALKQIQGVRISKLPDYRSAFARFTMEELFTGVAFEEASLDKETGDLFLDSVSFGTDRVGRFMVENAGKELCQAAF